MKIALINGSPKAKDSGSGHILQGLKSFFDGSHSILEYFFRKHQIDNDQMKEISQCEAIVFAFPLYVDGIPSHLLRCLIQLEEFFSAIDKKDIRVYALVNCGFYEGQQNILAINMIENWCEKSKLKWGQGIGIGGGGMLLSVKNVPLGHGPNKNLGEALKVVSNNILKGQSGENLFIKPNFPRLAYKLAGERGWRQGIKANGLKTKDLFRKK
ncbi:MAG: hypothetical protein RR891_11020 [Clostridium sp.]